MVGGTSHASAKNRDPELHRMRAEDFIGLGGQPHGANKPCRGAEQQCAKERVIGPQLRLDDGNKGGKAAPE